MKILMLFVYSRRPYCNTKSLQSEIIVMLSTLIVLLLSLTIVSGSLRNLSDSYWKLH